MSKAIDFVLYLPQDAGFSVPEECDTWEEDKNGMGGDLGFFERNPELEQLNTLELAKTDLENLLSLDYTEFWNQIENNTSILKFIDHFLCYSRRPGEGSISGLFGTADLHLEVSSLVFRTLIRLSKAKEGSTTFEDAFGEDFSEYIYRAWIWDTNRILDTVVLFGPSNPKDTHGILKRILLFPTYQEDIRTAFVQILNTLQDARGKFHSGENPDNLRIEMEVVLDIIVNLDALLEVYPQAARQYISLTTELIVQFETVLPLFSTYPPATIQTHQLRIARIMWNFLKEIYVKNINKKKEEGRNATGFCDCLVTGIQEAVKVAQGGTNDADYRLGLFADVFFSLFDNKPLDLVNRLAQNETVSKELLEVLLPPDEMDVQSSSVPENFIDNSLVDGDRLLTKEDQDVSKLQNMFECSPGFARALLSHCDGSLSRAVDSCLENNLPPHLQDVDRTSYSATTPTTKNIGRFNYDWNAAAHHEEEYGTGFDEEEEQYQFKSNILRRIEQMQYEDEVDDTYEGTSYQVDDAATTSLQDSKMLSHDMWTGNDKKKKDDSNLDEENDLDDKRLHSRPFQSKKDVDLRKGEQFNRSRRKERNRKKEEAREANPANHKAPPPGTQDVRRKKEFKPKGGSKKADAQSKGLRKQKEKKAKPRPFPGSKSSDSSSSGAESSGRGRGGGPSKGRGRGGKKGSGGRNSKHNQRDRAAKKQSRGT